MHFHFYYVSNNPSSVTAANAFINATTTQFGLAEDVCADNSGHEQPHNASCWLSGPGGSGPIGQPASNDTKVSDAAPTYGSAYLCWNELALSPFRVHGTGLTQGPVAGGGVLRIPRLLAVCGACDPTHARRGATRGQHGGPP